ncbi:MAG: alpha/beta hydrolase [Thermoanaerobaculia bacterium]|jgi:alpha-beta hydrolase superfamily lysophospholipase
MSETPSIEPAPPARPRAPRRLLGAARRVLSALGWFLLGNLVLLVTLGVLYLNGRPDLSIWHTATLDAEYDAKSDVKSFPEYMALEERLFRQLEEQVVAKVPPAQQSKINRYTRDSLSYPARWPRNWNRSFELAAEHPKAAVVLVHGMSDSPYSLHTIGEKLNAEGAYVVGLRLPGHGTIPGGLVGVTWRDFAAAVELAVRYAKEKSGGAPVYLVGYSTGAPLGVQYALRCLDDSALPKLDGLVVISPAMGVTPAAGIAVWQARLGHLLGLKKLEWQALGPEYDPFKYGAFAVNAADVVYRLAIEVQDEMDAAGPEKLAAMPPILAFQSAVDATVSMPAVVTDLFDRLPAKGHELVLFDINRHAMIEQIIAIDPKPTVQGLLAAKQLAYDVTIVTNESPQTLAVVARTKKAGQPIPSDSPLGLEWPRGVFSLSHVALPMRYDDPLYGGDESVPSPGIRIGRSELRGERGVLQISPGDMLRLRWSPFHPWMEGRILEFMKLGSSAPVSSQ